MKTHIGGLAATLLLALAANSLAATQFHDFLLKDGRSFRGRIVAYDHHTDIVKIVQADKRLIKTAPSVFDEADQLRIKEWHIVRCFHSTKLLRVKVVKKIVKGEKWQTFSFGGSGGSSGHLRNTYYDIIMENTSSIPFQNMTVEYQMHYRWGKTQGVKHGRFMVTKLGPKSKKEVRTAECIPCRFKPKDAGLLWSPGRGSKMDPKGIWIRIILPLSNDREAVREYCLPSNLNKHRKWTEKGVPDSVEVGNAATQHDLIKQSTLPNLWHPRKGAGGGKKKWTERLA